ncbi:hypothetical protein QUF72_02045 [Desulfobacterales bacterium HSG2]|nr:hypothetical protein [Desulfobacterales bacterium HSG2]
MLFNEFQNLASDVEHQIYPYGIIQAHLIDTVFHLFETILKNSADFSLLEPKSETVLLRHGSAQDSAETARSQGKRTPNKYQQRQRKKSGKFSDHHRLLSFKFQVSSIKHQVSSIKHQASSIQHPASSIQHQTPSIQHPASNTKHPASSIQHPASISFNNLICRLNNFIRYFYP